MLRRADAADAYVEDKGLAVAVHTRRLPDPEAAFERLLPVLRELAASNDLIVEPGRSVIEVRSPGMHKGTVVERLVEELEAGGFLFAGDDLGDLEAFDAVESLRERGLPTLLVCSASDEESAAGCPLRRRRRRPRGRARPAPPARRRRPRLPRVTPVDSAVQHGGTRVRIVRRLP